MRNALLIAHRELMAYLRSPLGYVVIAAVLLADAIWFQAFGLSGAKLSAEVLFEFFMGATGTTMLACIVLSMRLLAGERESGTIVLLNTAPVKDREIVAGKFLSAYAVVIVMTALTFYMPLLIIMDGRVSLGHVAVGYLGVLLLGAAALSIGIFASALSRSQVIAVIVGAIILATFVLLWALARVSDDPIKDYIEYLSLHHRRQRPFMNGILRLENVVFYLAMTYFFLLSATKVLEARRWR